MSLIIQLAVLQCWFFLTNISLITGAKPPRNPTGICSRSICEYTFYISKARTMTYQSPNGQDAFNVKLKGRALWTIGNSFRSRANYPDHIPKRVRADDVITGDGFPRNVILVNNQFPGPTIEVMENAQVVVNVINQLNAEAISVHWHGVEMYKTPHMDGTAYLTQCPILPAMKFVYRFRASNAGTHWYHSHSATMRLDAFFGFFIVHKRRPRMPYFTLSAMEWLHVDYDTMIITSPNSYVRPGTGEIFLDEERTDFSVDGAEISSLAFHSVVINGRGRHNGQQFPLHTFRVGSGRNYLFRMAHTGAEAPMEVSVDQHKISIVALDGSPIKSIGVDSFLIFPGETMDFEVRTDRRPDKYWIRVEMFREGKGPNPRPDGIVKGGKAVLSYANGPRFSSDVDPRSNRRQCWSSKPCVIYNCPFKGFPTNRYKTCVSIGSAVSSMPPGLVKSKYGVNKNERIDEYFFNFGFVMGASINGRSYAHPRRPPILPRNWNYETQCNQQKCEMSGCKCTHIHNLQYGRTIQLVLTNYQPGATILAHHPIHTHGHNFAVLKVGYPDYNPSTGRWTTRNPDIRCNNRLCTRPRWRNRCPTLNLKNPPIKDTVVVPAWGYVVIRFKATMPGYWFMHCHQDEHFLKGMALVFREAPQYIRLPYNFPKCGDFV